jgi:hypothetical protein
VRPMSGGRTTTVPSAGIRQHDLLWSIGGKYRPPSTTVAPDDPLLGALQAAAARLDQLLLAT